MVQQLTAGVSSLASAARVETVGVKEGLEWRMGGVHAAGGRSCRETRVRRERWSPGSRRQIMQRDEGEARERRSPGSRRRVVQRDEGEAREAKSRQQEAGCAERRGRGEREGRRDRSDLYRTCSAGPGATPKRSVIT